MAKGLIAKFATVGGATMASRVLGLLREALMASALAAGPVADVFYTCFRFPNLFRRLFAEGAFNIAFVPLFAKELEGGGEEAARKFGQEVFAVLASWLLVFTALALVFMPYLVATVVAPGFADTPEKFDLAVTMTMIMFPYLLFMSLVAMFSGILNSLRKYFIAAIVPVLLNVILVAILLYALWADMEPRQIGLTLAWGVFASGVAQFGLLWWSVRRENMRFALAFPRLTAPVKRLLVLMGPSLLTGGVLQINILIGTVIATMQDGANALLNYADRLNQLPLGIIGIAVGVVLLPELSRALQSGDPDEAEKLQNRSLEFALALTLPAAVGLMLLPHDIIRLVYERGAFTAETTELTANALIAFASGLPAYVLIKVFQPAFFAREDMKTPFYLSCVMVVVNVVLSLSLFPTLGHVAIALSTSISAWVNVLGLATVLWMRNSFRPQASTLKAVLFIAIGSALMAALIMLVQPLLASWLLEGVFLTRLAALGALIASAMVVYFGFIIATGVIEKSQIKRLVKRG
ncbi:murein biosynthesis integral membrane protein MurJ [Pseudahrensia aquimaris]|uniref:Probable lipid II flippase MurJ n=1 Tax=Pseudahrensia aquimaris TaxID=744461 RepID=A0ABW3FJI9_9HYPH